MAVQELLPSGINAVCLVHQSLPSDHFVLKLDVCQLVCQFRHIGTFDHLGGWCEVQLEQELVEKSLRVDDTVVREDLVVQSTMVFFLVNCFQLGFRSNAQRRFVSRA